MISELKNKEGFILAYIEWEVVDKWGQFQDDGEYIYIQNIWIHENFRNNGVIKNFRKQILIHPFSKNAKYVYWDNLKHSRLVSSYSLDKWRKGVTDGI